MTNNTIMLTSRERELLTKMNVNPDGEIAAADVGICWGLPGYWPGKGQEPSLDPKASDLRVINLRAITDGDGLGKRDLASHGDVGRWEAASFATGCNLADWMVNPRSTPEGVFAGLLFDGHIPSGKQLGPVLKEFAKIEECAWARRQLAALAAPDIWFEDGHAVNL